MSRRPLQLPPMYPGGCRVGAEEEAAVVEVLRSRRLFRYYGAVDGPSAVAAFEADFTRRFGELEIGETLVTAPRVVTR